VAVTAYHDPENRRRCFEAGMVEVINKPAKLEEIVEVVERFAPLLSDLKKQPLMKMPSRVSSSRSSFKRVRHATMK